MQTVSMAWAAHHHKYSYSGGLYQSPMEQREFLGFKVVQTTDSLNNIYVTTFLQNDNAVSGVNLFKGKIAEQDVLITQARLD